MKAAAHLILAMTLLTAFGRTATAQGGGIPMARPPALPATAEENWKFERFAIHERVTVYNAWRSNRKRIAVLAPGSIVKGLGKLSVVYQPDAIGMTAAFGELGLNTGDTILRYTVEGEGFADFWMNQRWYREFDGSFIIEPNGDGCSKNCRAKVTTIGHKEWWAHIQLRDGRTGWIRVER